MIRFMARSLVLLTCLFTTLELHAADGLPAGIVKQKPESGRFVETPAGFMVEHKVTIPGTEVSFIMVPIRGGTIKVGSPDSEANRDDSEGPQFEVEVQPFWMGKFEVSWAEYKSYMKMHDIFKQFESKKIRNIGDGTKSLVITAPSNLYDTSFTYVSGDKPELPAVTMSQYAAKQYTKWLSLLTKSFYRLPTEAEWEHACRAGTTTAYHFGDDPKELKNYGWFYDNSDGRSRKIGQLKPNPWGLYDMHGNVAEWVLDGMLDDGYTKFAGKKLSTADALVTTDKLFPRVVKGGNWDLDPEDCRSASRLPSHDDNWRSEDPNFPLSPWWFTSGESLGVGMRIIRPLNPAPTADREKYWKADISLVQEDVDFRIDEEGRGARGFVDEKLPSAIEMLKKLLGE